MNNYQIAYDAKDVSANVKAFLTENKAIFWNVFRPLLPYIIGLHLLDIVLAAAGLTFIQYLPIGHVLASYFMTALVITWHRVTLHGPDNFVPMNPFKPQKNELIFIGMGLVVFGLFPFLSAVLTFGIGGGLGAVLKMPVLSIVFLVLALGFFLWSLYYICLFLFYFPARALNTPITLKESAYLTRGYIWKILWGGFRTSFKILIAVFLYTIVGAVLIGVFLTVTGNAQTQNIVLNQIMTFVFELPLTVYFAPILSVIGVMVLSNYYQHALQNKPPFEKKPL